MCVGDTSETDVSIVCMYACFCVCELYLLCVLVSITIGMALSYLFPSIGLSVVTVASRDREQVDGAVCFLGPGK